MNFTNLYYFTVVAEELSITKAAERLFISQQSLSKHIIRIENDMGTKLFERAPSFTLTYAGQRLLNTARQILDLRRQIYMEIDDINQKKRGQLKIGISHTRGRVFLPKIFLEFKQTHPYIDIRVKEGNSQELEDWLLHGQIDLLVGFSPIVLDVAETVDIFTERLFLVVPQKYIEQLYPNNYKKMIEKFEKGINVDVFKDFPFMLVTAGNRTRTLFDKHLSNRNLSVEISYEMENIETLLSFACIGMGITVYPEMFANNLSPMLLVDAVSPVKFFPINDPSTKGKLVIAYNRDRYLSKPALDFIETCKKLHDKL